MLIETLKRFHFLFKPQSLEDVAPAHHRDKVASAVETTLSKTNEACVSTRNEKSFFDMPTITIKDGTQIF